VPTMHTYDDDDNKPVWPTWAVGALLLGQGCENYSHQPGMSDSMMIIVVSPFGQLRLRGPPSLEVRQDVFTSTVYVKTYMSIWGVGLPPGIGPKHNSSGNVWATKCCNRPAGGWWMSTVAGNRVNHRLIFLFF
jgi:hypothetical protein